MKQEYDIIEDEICEIKYKGMTYILDGMKVYNINNKHKNHHFFDIELPK